MEPSISSPGEERGQSQCYSQQPANQSPPLGAYPAPTANILVSETAALLMTSPSSELSYFPLSPNPPRQEEELGEGPTDLGLADALCSLYGANACTKSQAQYELCREVLLKQKDILAILPTGSGKSTAWLVAALADPHSTVAVIVPYQRLLDQHLETAIAHKLNATRWIAETKSNVPLSTNLLFLACESAKSTAFSQ